MKGVPRTIELHTDSKDCVNQDLSCIISIILFGKTVFGRLFSQHITDEFIGKRI